MVADSKQAGMPEGVVAGKWSWAELKNASGEITMHLTLRHPNETVSIDLSPDEWDQLWPCAVEV